MAYKQKAHEIILHEGQPARLYPDGSIRDDNGLFLAMHPGGSDKVITPETARSLVMAREERKQAVVQEAANGMTARNIRETFGEYAFVAEITRTAMKKATNPADPKMVDAARFIFQESGHSKQKEHDNAGDIVRDVMQNMADVARAIVQLHAVNTGDNDG